nr:MAG TPA: hypothetical protein [Inoviridae sp.]
MSPIFSLSPKCRGTNKGGLISVGTSFFEVLSPVPEVGGNTIPQLRGVPRPAGRG